MQVARISVSENHATAHDLKMITSGMVGATVTFEFDETWEGFTKMYVFRSDGKILDDFNATGIIPAELLQPGKRLEAGVYGTKGTVAIPTVYADLGVVRTGADPSGDESTDPSLPVWAQLQAKIEELKKQQGGGAVDPDEVRRIVDAYLTDHPPGAGEDGYSPTVTIEAIDGGTRLTITDKTGPHTMDILNGADGHTPVQGEDYFTEADKQEMVNAVLAALPTWEGGSY